MENIRYKPIPNHPGYRAGSDGSIWSCLSPAGRHGGPQMPSDKWKLLKGCPRKEDGRLRYTIRAADGAYRRTYGYILTMEAFVGPNPDPSKFQCCHYDGNCLNGNIDNLRWDTIYANRADSHRHGTTLRGSKSPMAKLKEKDVLRIRRIGYPLGQHAVKYGVTTTLISLILKRRIWKHV